MDIIMASVSLFWMRWSLSNSLDSLLNILLCVCSVHIFCLNSLHYLQTSSVVIFFGFSLKLITCVHYVWRQTFLLYAVCHDYVFGCTMYALFYILFGSF